MTVSFSIIITTLDRKDMALAAIDSVRAQNFPHTEIIVADGGSRDGTVEVLSGAPDVEVLPGPDGGVYDAWNKSIARAKGDVVALLNSDDHYPPGTLSAIAAAFAEHPDAEAVCGRAELENEEGNVVIFDDDAEKALKSPATALLGACVINARFFRRNSMIRVGRFDLAYRYVSDRDWLVRWSEARMTTATVPDLVYCYRQHETSLTFDADRRHAAAIYAELLALARRWRGDIGASRAARAAAAQLEGQCVGRMFLSKLRQRQFGEAILLLTHDGGRWSSMPATNLIRAVMHQFLKQHL